VDGNGLPVQIGLTAGEAHDNRLCTGLLSGLRHQALLLADRGYDADWIRPLVAQRVARANIPPKRNRKGPICFGSYFYRARNLVERFFNKIKQSTYGDPRQSASRSSGLFDRSGRPALSRKGALRISWR
jgi:transposase